MVASWVEVIAIVCAFVYTYLAGGSLRGLRRIKGIKRAYTCTTRRTRKHSAKRNVPFFLSLVASTLVNAYPRATVGTNVNASVREYTAVVEANATAARKSQGNAIYRFASIICNTEHDRSD